MRRAHLGPDRATTPVGRVDDPQEREADRLAERVVAAPSPERRPEVDGREPVWSARPSVVPGGRPLDDRTRAAYEPHLGIDLTAVRIHDGPEAAAAAEAAGAQAYTVGSDVVFGAGRYAPATPAGEELLAHELGHVAQQVDGEPTLRRRPVEKGTRPAPVVEMEALTVEGSARDFEDSVRYTANRVSDRAKLNALGFAAEVGSACQAFEVYAAQRVEEIEDRVTAADLASGLATVVLGAVGGALAARIGSELAKQLAEKSAEQFAGAMAAQIKSASRSSKDAKDLRLAIFAVVMGAHDGATAVRDTVTTRIQAVADGIVAAVNEGRPLTAAQDEFIRPFYMANSEDTDRLLEDHYGIPGAARASTIQLNVYEALVRAFARRLIMADVSMKESLEMHFAQTMGPYESTLDYKAAQMGRDARRTREEELRRAR